MRIPFPSHVRSDIDWLAVFLQVIISELREFVISVIIERIVGSLCHRSDCKQQDTVTRVTLRREIKKDFSPY